MSQLLLLVIGCTLPVVSFAIQCYVCSQTTDPGGPNDNYNCGKANHDYLTGCSENDLTQYQTVDIIPLKNSAVTWTNGNSLEVKQANFTCAKVEILYGGYTTILRGCSDYAIDICTVETYTTEIENGTTETCYCNTDKCNSSNVIPSSAVSIIAVILVIIPNYY